MNRVLKSCLSLPFALAMPLVAQAQSADDGSDYSDYFGDEAPVSDGPATMRDAQEQGRGYRIGTNGRPLVTPDRYTVRSGDTLWSITGQYLGDSWQWPQVW